MRSTRHLLSGGALASLALVACLAPSAMASTAGSAGSPTMRPANYQVCDTTPGPDVGTGLPPGPGVVSTEFSSATDPYNAAAVARFKATYTCKIWVVFVRGGQYAGSSTPVSSFTVSLYKNVGGVPAPLPFYSSTQAPTSTGCLGIAPPPGGVCRIKLIPGDPYVLQNQIYYVSVVANVATTGSATAPFWYWDTTPGTVATGGEWKNPGTALASCPTWAAGNLDPCTGALGLTLLTQVNGIR